MIRTCSTRFEIADSDSLNFIATANLTLISQKYAIADLVSSLKTANLWTKLYAIYPFIGGTAASHRFNLKDSRDLDAAYRISFVGSATHSATGVLWNGTNSYGNTFIIPSTIFGTSGSGLGYFSRTGGVPPTTDIVEFGADNTATQAFFISTNHNAGGTVTRHFATLSVLPNKNSGAGLYSMFRLGTTSYSVYENGLLLGTGTSDGAIPTVPMYIGALNLANAPYGYSKREVAFAFVSSYLNITEQATLYNIIRDYQRSLSRFFTNV